MTTVFSSLTFPNDLIRSKIVFFGIKPWTACVFIYLFIYSFIRNHTKRSHILPFIHHPLPSQTPPQHPVCLYILSSASSMCENFIAHYMLEHDEMTDDLLGPKKRLGCGHFYLHAVAACQLFFSSRTGNNTGSLN